MRMAGRFHIPLRPKAYGHSATDTGAEVRGFAKAPIDERV